LEQEPTDDEIAAHLGLDERRVRQYREAARPPSTTFIFPHREV
jgi:DNA-directed RNA polymerase specialized sigma subunit